MLQQLRISVGATWRLATDEGRTTVLVDKTGYRAEFNRLKDGNATGPLALPWPSYKSTFWTAMLGGPYASVASYRLVAALTPTRVERPLGQPVDGIGRPAMLEVLSHPFAVSTMVHFDLLDVPVDDGAVAELVSGFLRQPVGTTGRQVRDGVSLDEIVHSSTTDADGHAAAHQACGSFVLLSGLHHEAPDPPALAAGLASLFQANPAASRMHTTGTGIAVTDAKVGIVLPRNALRAGVRMGCLHHNQALLLAMMENMAAVVQPAPSIAAGWFQSQAALVLNSLYRRVPIPEVNGVYRSRLAELWLRERHLVDAINTASQNLPTAPPALPTD